MARAPFQILVIPFRRIGNAAYEFAVFSRADGECWQGIAGGGEDDETPIAAAKREAFEEGGISPTSYFIALGATASIRVTCFADSHLWGDEIYVIPEHCFGADVGDAEITLSSEHREFRWLSYGEAETILKYDSNKVALWELNQRIRGLGPRASEVDGEADATTTR